MIKCVDTLVDSKTLDVVYHVRFIYSKTCLMRPLKKNTKIGFQDQLSLNAGQEYCRMLQGENSAILSTFIKLPYVIKIFVLSFCEWPLKTGFSNFLSYAFKWEKLNRKFHKNY